MTAAYPVVEVTPAVRFGRPTMRGVSTDVLAALYWAENGDAVAVCHEYGLDVHELAVALWFEATYGDARTEYPGWAEWAEQAYPRLAGWKALDVDTLPLPPGRDDTEGDQK